MRKSNARCHGMCLCASIFIIMGSIPIVTEYKPFRMIRAAYPKAVWMNHAVGDAAMPFQGLARCCR